MYTSAGAPGTYMNLGGGGVGGGGDGGGGGGGSQFSGEEYSGSGSDSGVGAGGRGEGGGGGGGVSCSLQGFPQGHDPHLISVSSNLLEDVVASTGDETVMQRKRRSTIAKFWGLFQLCVGDTIFFFFLSRGLGIWFL